MTIHDMGGQGSALAEAFPALERRIGRYWGAEAGPMLLCIAGIHGNEPAGIEALRRVLGQLEDRRPGFRGDLVGIAGNLTALARRCRYVDEDLNRGWQRSRVEAVRVGGIPGTEGREQRKLLAAMDEASAAARGEVYVLDFHTTSSESRPFVTLGDTLPNRALAAHFPIPIILGLEEQIDGALLEHLDNEGLIGLGIEGGSHDSADSVDSIESVLWLALAAVGNLELADTPALRAHRDRLAQSTPHLPPVMEVRYRHVIGPGDRFSMKPGYENFHPIDQGEVVGTDREGTVAAPVGGRIFMPLYQVQGDDGFFIVRQVRPFWLRVAALLRRLRLPAIAPFLPGVRRHPERADALILKPWAADGAVTGLLHLLGFKRRLHGDEILMIRRKRDRPYRMR